MSTGPAGQVALIGHMRSGTTVVRQLIGSAPGCFDMGEVFHAYTDRPCNFWGHVGQLARDLPAFRHPSAWPEAWAGFVDLQRARFDARIVVFDAKIEYFPYIVRHDGLRDWFFFDAPDVRYVWLHRRNLLAQVLSRWRALQTDVWSETDSHAGASTLRKFRQLEVQHGRTGAGSPVATIDPDAAHAAVDRLARTNAALLHKLAGRISLHLSFEDLFDADGRFSAATVAGLAQVCGIDARLFDRQPVLRRQSDGPLLSGIANADALRARFAGSPHAWMLDA